MPHRILVVDDVPDACEVLARLLRVCGFEVGTANHGAHALDLLDGFAPDVVILDLNMPVMDGYGFLEAVRKMPTWNRVRVIVFTADHKYDGPPRAARRREGLPQGLHAVPDPHGRGQQLSQSGLNDLP